MKALFTILALSLCLGAMGQSVPKPPEQTIVWSDSVEWNGYLDTCCDHFNKNVWRIGGKDTIYRKRTVLYAVKSDSSTFQQTVMELRTTETCVGYEVKHARHAVYEGNEGTVRIYRWYDVPMKTGNEVYPELPLGAIVIKIIETP